jgi:ATP-binding cassette, subfamily B, bacterial PglK
MFKILWKRLSLHRKRQFYLLAVLMFIASLFEMISIGAVLPFLGVLTSPESMYKHELLQPFIRLFEITSPDHLIWPLTLIFIAAVVFSGVIRLLLLYHITRFSQLTGSDLSIDIYRRTLYQNYSVHVMRNSSEVINGIITKTGMVVGSVITPILNLISAIILLLGIMSVLLSIDFVVSSGVFLGFGLIYFGIVLYAKSYLKDNSKCIATQSSIMIKSLQEGLGGVRDVLIDGTQEFYCKIYQNADLSLRKAAANNQFIGGSPKYAIESIGMALIAGLAYILVQQSGGASAIPMLGALALGAQRLFPLLQQIYSSYSAIIGAKSSFKDVVKLLEQKIPDNIEKASSESFEFNKTIQMQNISFQYTKTSSKILKNINLTINKGESIGFIGETGSGKSTLLDVVMMLFIPTSGSLNIDGQEIDPKNTKAWQSYIAHVPQNIYLFDSTIEENIAFGVSKDCIDRKRVKQAARIAQITDMINSLEDGYETVVGEQGVRLSGGQRQRIGIARALYKEADILILDEATSALDNKTEEKIMKSIESLKKEVTVLIIAHRLTTLKNCDKIFRLNKDGAIESVNYQEVINEK